MKKLFLAIMVVLLMLGSFFAGAYISVMSSGNYHFRSKEVVGIYDVTTDDERINTGTGLLIKGYFELVAGVLQRKEPERSMWLYELIVTQRALALKWLHENPR